MKHIIRMVMAAVLFVLNTGFATAGQTCAKGAYFDTAQAKCVAQVQQSTRLQDIAAASGPQWGPVNRANCAAASLEMDLSAKKCRSYDARRGGYDALLAKVTDGKLLEQCAKCCRQLREGMNRWIQCHAAGFAPKPDLRTARRSADRMNCGHTY